MSFRYFFYSVNSGQQLLGRSVSFIGNFSKTKRKFNFTRCGNFYLRNISTPTTTFQASIEKITDINKGVSIRFDTKEEHKFNYIWLRDHCGCKECYDHTTFQKIQDTQQIPLDISPKHVTHQGNNFQLTWPDGHVTNFAASWLLENHYGQPAHTYVINPEKRIFWGSEAKNNMVEGVDYEKILSDDASLYKLLKNISVYGYGFVSNTPTTVEDLKNVGKRIAPLRQSHYGETWELTNLSEEEEYEHLDNSYSNVALPAHTDGTYFHDAPGLQFFHCHKHDGKGGDSLLVDGIHAANQLRRTEQASFEFLASTFIPASYYEPEYYTRGFAPIIKVDPISNEVYQVRINNLDREVLKCLNFDDIQKFYEAIHKFTNILTDKRNELWFKLTPGNLLITNNWRVLHGRSAFTGSRTLSGLYINHDDYLSKMRLLQQRYE